MKVGDWVEVVGSLSPMWLEVLAIEDKGHGVGNERVTVRLFGMLTRDYAKKELEVVPASEREFWRLVRGTPEGGCRAGGGVPGY